jgi:hypothetical protein
VKLSEAVDVGDRPMRATMSELIMAQQILENAPVHPEFDRALRLIKSELLRRK